MVSGIVIAFALLAFVGIYASFARWRAQHMASTVTCHDVFYKAAFQLVEDDRTPPEVLQVVSFLSENLRNGAALRNAVWAFLRRRAPAGAKAEAQQKYLQKCIEDMPEQLRRLFAQVIVAGLWAISFESAFLGPFVRRLVYLGTWVKQRSREQDLDGRMVTIAEGMRECVQRG